MAETRSFIAESISSIFITLFIKPISEASSASNGLQVITSSFVKAGPISLTSLGIPPQAKGIPRSTSGMEKLVSMEAILRSQAAASTRPPPTT